eukprot:3313103-Lingulodinium_polyedra.AAC.1
MKGGRWPVGRKRRRVCGRKRASRAHALAAANVEQTQVASSAVLCQCQRWCKGRPCGDEASIPL